MCIAHQLKQADYKKMGELMKQDTFDTFNQILYLVVANGQRLESFVGKIDETINIEYRNTVSTLRKKGAHFIKELEQQLKSGWGWYAYMPPEARGAMIASITDVMRSPQNTNNNDLRQLAAFSINELLATTQSPGHLDNTLDRITVAMGEVPGRNNGVQSINAVIAGTAFAGCIDRAEIRIARASPLMGRPFLRNDDGDFIVAQFPLHHSGYDIA